MAPCTVSLHINAPPATVFALASDVRSWVGRVKAIKKVEVLTSGNVGLGTKWRETRMMFGREATEKLEFVWWSVGKSYAVGCESCGAKYRTTFEFIPEDGGTLVKVSMVVKPVTFFAKLMSPLGALMMGGMKKCLLGDLEDLKREIESGGAAPA
jgi:uncharacterized protein YndB with AHSA1/START domain